MISEIKKNDLRAIPIWSRSTGKKLLASSINDQDGYGEANNDDNGGDYDEDDDDNDDVTKGCNVQSFHPRQIAPEDLMNKQGY